MDDLGAEFPPHPPSSITSPPSSAVLRSPSSAALPLTPSRVIQKKIGGENIVISPNQLESFFSLPITPEFRTILDAGITRKVIDPDYALLSLIKRFRSSEYIYPIAISLRLGANPNMYITDTESGVLGTIHILGYVYFMWRKNKSLEERYLNTVVLLLLHYNSSPMRAIYDDRGGGIKPIGEQGSARNVLDWLNGNNYPHILNAAYPDYLSQLTPQVKNLLAMLTGNRALIAEPFKEQDIEKIVQARNTWGKNDGSEGFGHYNLLPDCPDPQLKDSLGIDYLVLIWALDNYDYHAIAWWTGMGIIMSYPLFTKLLIRLKYHAQQDDVLLYENLSRMLESMIGSGYVMDTDQMLFLEGVSKPLHDRIMSIYSQPYWVKVCSFNPSPSLPAGSVVPLRLKAAAADLGIENVESHYNVCRQLRQLSESETDKLKIAAKNRQLSRLGAKHGYISDFAAGTCPPVLYCVNRSTMDGEYSDYSDIGLSSYRDGNGDVWCFFSSNYEHMVDTKKNPINGSLLPESFVSEIATKREMMADLGVDIKKPPKLSESIDALMKPDTIDNSISQAKLQELFGTTSSVIAKEKLRSLSQVQLQTILSSVGYDIQLTELSRSLALSVFAYIINHYSATSKSRYNTILEKMRVI
jgi:hypothetical protein